MIRLLQWDGLTDRACFDDWYREERDRFADMARDAAWNRLFEALGERPEWVNLPRPGNRSGFSPTCSTSSNRCPYGP
ncbi:hypothetical protein AB0I06_05275 [Streptomyces sp. NPDC050674]|uniref:hypothetical protein n=1 Tax=Streptomyces sp. NPDC050674 TaxID=3157216 RepID=UPI003446E2C2